MSAFVKALRSFWRATKANVLRNLRRRYGGKKYLFDEIWGMKRNARRNDFYSAVVVAAAAFADFFFIPYIFICLMRWGVVLPPVAEWKTFPHVVIRKKYNFAFAAVFPSPCFFCSLLYPQHLRRRHNALFNMFWWYYQGVWLLSPSGHHLRRRQQENQA